jgi:magnesium and cobalt exporter, CNNM family
MSAEITLLIVLLVLSGFFSSAETALFSISHTKAIHLAKSGGRANHLIKMMKGDAHRLLTTILIGNNVVNVGAAALATSVTIRMFPDYAIGLATGVMTFLILVFGEVFPKSLATRNNVFIARMAIYPLYWLSILLFPVIKFLEFIPLLTGKMRKTSKVTEEELMTFVEVVEEEGEIKEEEREFIHNIFEFDDTNASEIMTPRADMFVVDANELLDLKAIARSGFTRIPVIDSDIDHIIGILNVKDLFMHQATAEQDPDIRKLMRQPYFVPENKKLDSLMHQFKNRKNHLAIIVDEHGGVSGLITLEDVLEELVGEITDETDKEEPEIIQTSDSEWIVPGKSDIEEVNEALPLDIPDSKEYDTFSGYVLDQIGRIPREKESLELNNYTVIVNKMDGNRIKEYIVRRDTLSQDETTEPDNRKNATTSAA